MKCVSILGSTGSVGRQSLDVVSRLPEIRVAALTAGSSVERMAEQCRQFRPELAVMATQEAAEALAEELKKLGADAYYLPSFEAIENFVLKKVIHGDVLITMGAGDVVNIGENLLK